MSSHADLPSESTIIMFLVIILRFMYLVGCLSESYVRGGELSDSRKLCPPCVVGSSTFYPLTTPTGNVGGGNQAHFLPIHTFSGRSICNHCNHVALLKYHESALYDLA